MGKITFYNMGFGDSFLIKDDYGKLLVDCGTINYCSSVLNKVLNLIGSQVCNNNSDLLLTHYHADHFNKIEDLSNKGIRFQNIYVRNLGKRSLFFNIYSFVTNLINYAYLTGDYHTFFFWADPRKLINFLTPTGHVVGVNNATNNVFSIGKMKAKVLWPGIICPYNFSKIKKEFDDLLVKYPKIRKLLVRNINFYEQIDLSSIVPRERIQYLLNNEDEFINADNQVTVRLEITKIVHDEKFKKIIEYMRDYENHLSIVFEVENKLLMCGDASKKAMKEVMKSLGNKVFSIVKVPHHGTEDYFLGSLYSSNSTLLISNSLYRKVCPICSSYCSCKCRCLNSIPGYTACSSTKSTCHILKYFYRQKF